MKTFKQFKAYVLLGLTTCFMGACSNKQDALKPQSVQVVVSTFAGGNQGDADGTGKAATFYGPTSLATDAQGNIYVTDFDNNQIRKITSAGMVSTFAGGSTYGSARSE